MALECVGNKSRGLHVLDKSSLASTGTGTTAYRRSHRLFNYHETSLQQAQAWIARCVELELLPDARGYMMIFK
jgi:hypothetical protein